MGSLSEFVSGTHFTTLIHVGTYIIYTYTAYIHTLYYGRWYMLCIVAAEHLKTKTHQKRRRSHLSSDDDNNNNIGTHVRPPQL